MNGWLETAFTIGFLGIVVLFAYAIWRGRNTPRANSSIVASNEAIVEGQKKALEMQADLLAAQTRQADALERIAKALEAKER